MQYMKKILLAVDFGTTLKASQEQAVKLARKFNAEIIPLHAVEYVPYHLYTKSLEEVYADLYNKMVTICESISDAGVQVSEPVMDVCQAHDLILRTVENDDINIIILGGGRKGLFEKYVLGSTAEKVIHQSSAPVLVVHADEHTEMRNLLCAFDYSPAASQSLKSAVHLAHLYDAHLHVLHVLPDPAVPYYLSASDALLFDYDQLDDDEVERKLEAKKKLMDHLHHFDADRLNNLSVKVVVGRPHDHIMKYCAVHSIDMLIMGAVGFNGFLTSIVGNTTSSLIRKAPCSILTTHDQDIFKVSHDFNQEFLSNQPYDEEKSRGLLTYLDDRFARGEELCKNGFHDDALMEFQECLTKDNYYIKAYDAMADIFDTLEDPVQAQHYRHLSQAFSNKLKWKTIEADVRKERGLINQ